MDMVLPSAIFSHCCHFQVLFNLPQISRKMDAGRTRSDVVYVENIIVKTKTAAAESKASAFSKLLL